MTHNRTLYVSDLDGTLLNSDSVISPASQTMLNRLISEHDVCFTIATARTPATVSRIMGGIENAPLPFIVLAGAARWQQQAPHYSHVKVIPEHVVQEIIQVERRQGLNPFVYRCKEDSIMAYHHGLLSADELEFVEQRIHTPHKTFVLDCDPTCGNNGDAMLVYLMGDYTALSHAYASIHGVLPCEAMLYHDIFNHELGYLEVYAQGVTKAAAVTEMAQELGAERIMVFGDNRNDIPMMSVATHSVAVDNAFPEVKAVAHEVIGPNTSDSVAQRIAQDFRR